MEKNTNFLALMPNLHNAKIRLSVFMDKERCVKYMLNIC